MSTEKSTDRQHLPIDVLERLATEQPGGGPVAAETLPDILRCLLFGLLAYQNGLIDQSVLIDALRAIARGKSGSVAETLVVQGSRRQPPRLDRERARRESQAPRRRCRREPCADADGREHPGPARGPERHRA